MCGSMCSAGGHLWIISHAFGCTAILNVISVRLVGWTQAICCMSRKGVT